MSKRRKAKAAAETSSDNPELEFKLAHTEFLESVSALFDETYELMSDGTTAVVHSRYASLSEATAGVRGDGGRLAAKSLPPVWLPSVSLLDEIDTAICLWDNGRKALSTPQHIDNLVSAPCGPSDTKRIAQWAKILRAWAQDIDHLLYPESVKTVSAPCPNCGATHVYRQDDGGDTVRRPALQIVTSRGCECLACRTIWPPERYHLLAKILECPHP